MLVSQWESLVQTLPKQLLILFSWTITLPLLLSHLDMVEVFMIMSENSCNSSLLLMFALCLLCSWDLLFLETLHLTLFRCFGSTWSWTLLEPLLFPLNHQPTIFWIDNHKEKTIKSFHQSCGEIFSAMLSSKLSCYWF